MLGNGVVSAAAAATPGVLSPSPSNTPPGGFSPSPSPTEHTGPLYSSQQDYGINWGPSSQPAPSIMQCSSGWVAQPAASSPPTTQQPAEPPRLGPGGGQQGEGFAHMAEGEPDPTTPPAASSLFPGSSTGPPGGTAQSGGSALQGRPPPGPHAPAPMLRASREFALKPAGSAGGGGGVPDVPPCSLRLDPVAEGGRKNAWGVYGERWAARVRRLQRESPHARQQGWALRCVIVKSGDDCRQVRAWSVRLEYIVSCRDMAAEVQAGCTGWRKAHMICEFGLSSARCQVTV